MSNFKYCAKKNKYDDTSKYIRINNICQYQNKK